MFLKLVLSGEFCKSQFSIHMKRVVVVQRAKKYDHSNSYLAMLVAFT